MSTDRLKTIAEKTLNDAKDPNPVVTVTKQQLVSTRNKKSKNKRHKCKC
jgi:hypothetical protein